MLSLASGVLVEFESRAFAGEKSAKAGQARRLSPAECGEDPVHYPIHLIGCRGFRLPGLPGQSVGEIALIHRGP
jgi:hypothetical protein